MAEKISKEQVKHIAELTKLHLSSEETGKFTKQLGDVLDYVESLPEKNEKLIIKNEELGTGILREDKVIAGDISTQELLENVPQTDGTSIRVPAVLGSDDE